MIQVNSTICKHATDEVYNYTYNKLSFDTDRCYTNDVKSLRVRSIQEDPIRAEKVYNPECVRLTDYMRPS